MKNNDSRRDFLKKMLAASVMGYAFPHVLMGQIEPELIKKKEDYVTGLYHLELEKYPELKELWGSVRMRIPALDGSYKDIIVSRVEKKKCDRDFTAIWELCPHEGQQVQTLHSELHIFLCTGHGTVFDCCGHYIDGPAARDLEIYPTFYDGGDTVFIELYYYLNSVEESGKIDGLAYLKQNNPNPAKDYAIINFGLEKQASISIDLFDISGNKIENIITKNEFPGDFSQKINVSHLSAGVYIYKLSINGNRNLFRKMVVIR